MQTPSNKIVILCKPCDYEECMESEDSCDCGDDYTILVNDRTGYGGGQWVQDDHGKDLISCQFLGRHFEVESVGAFKQHVEIMLHAFNNVKVSIRRTL